MTLAIESAAFEDGGRIPREYGYEDRNVNPPLTISGVPEGTESLAIIVDDPDAKPVAGTVWDHWIVWNIPGDRTRIPEDWDPASTGAAVGETDYGEQRYGGPNPPNEPHEYRFQVYALDTSLSLSGPVSADDLRAAMEGHVLDEAELRGTYRP